MIHERQFGVGAKRCICEIAAFVLLTVGLTGFSEAQNSIRVYPDPGIVGLESTPQGRMNILITVFGKSF